MKVLSIRQPWAWLIVRPDITDQAKREEAYRARTIKDIENRTWPTKFRGELLIHAGKGMTREEYKTAAEFAFNIAWASGDRIPLPRFEDLDRGGIVGMVDIVDCVSQSASPWFVGEYGFVPRNAKPLPFTPMRGMLGFFDAPADFVLPLETA